MEINKNSTGHGHVIPNENGSMARCGGPGICGVCSSELAQLKIEEDKKKQFQSHQPAVVKSESESTNS